MEIRQSIVVGTINKDGVGVRNIQTTFNNGRGTQHVNFATQLDRDLGTTSFFVRFNSGRHISETGRELSRLIEHLVQQYPHPIEDLTLVGHSAGGLVVRSAAHYGREHGATWIDLLDRIVCIEPVARGITPGLEDGPNIVGTLTTERGVLVVE